MGPRGSPPTVAAARTGGWRAAATPVCAAESAPRIDAGRWPSSCTIEGMARAVRLALVSMLLLGPLAVSGAARAQPAPTVQARDHVRAGLAYAERGKWEEALREFEEAY